MSINSKLGDPNQNSYVTATQANDYFSNRRNTDSWDNLATSDKEAVLIQAARDLDRFNYIEERYYESQGLAFPFSDHNVVTGNCSTPFTNTSFRHINLYSDVYGEMPTDFWEYGSVHITEGTPLNDIRLISNSNVTNGSITVANTFTATPNANTGFIIFEPVDQNVRDAQCEQALFLVNNDNMSDIYNYKSIGVNSVKIGDTAVSFKSGNLTSIAISSTAKKLLSRWIRRILRVGRA